MADDTLEWLKFGLELACAVGAVYGFTVAREDWKQSQRWRKSEELEKIIDRFEADETCRLACALVDWSSRTVTYREAAFSFTSANALEAVAIHDVDEIASYTMEAAVLRDALDGFLAFLVRLEAALARDFIEVAHAKPQLAYWVKHLVTYERHAATESAAAERIARYVARYSDPHALLRLCKSFEIESPELEAVARRGAELKKLAISPAASRPLHAASSA